MFIDLQFTTNKNIRYLGANKDVFMEYFLSSILKQL